MSALGIAYRLPEIAAMGGSLDLFQGLPEQAPLRYIAFDTRLIYRGDETVFVALSGRRDGHTFLSQAYDLGVRNFVVSRPMELRACNYALTDNGLDFIQRWAAAHRARFQIPVAGITGSNGKTIVKEWLATLLEARFQLVKSPMSYNSQLGVPLSVLQLHPQAEVGIFEAGISRAGEMDALREIIQPTLGIFTHLGEAHAEGFEGEGHKLNEKSKLFESCQTVLAHSHQPEVTAYFQQKHFPLCTVGQSANADMRVRLAAQSLEIECAGASYRLPFPFATQADRENALLALAAARELGMDWPEIASRLPLLRPLRMRAELISDNPEITLLNDAYTADPDSVRHAFAALARVEAQPRRQIILSDLPHLGLRQESLQRSLLQEAEALAGREGVHTVGPVFQSIRPFQAYADTDDLLRQFRYEDFRHSAVLLKGARAFELERVAPLLTHRPNAASFRIDLDALAANLRALKSCLRPGVRVMCMVKAASYGAGTWEIAQALEAEGVDYLAVAFASEGVALRRHGIRTPILVMNPDPFSYEALLQFDLEPEIFSADLLRQWAHAARWTGNPQGRFHLKLETGMGRLGLRKDEIPLILEVMRTHPDLQMVSVMSHFAAADDPAHDEFSRTQAHRFLEMTEAILAEGIFPLRHMANTAASLRFPEYQFDMARLGLGLYGINPVEGSVAPVLKEIGALSAPISHIQTYAAGDSIGYGRAQVLNRPSRIATLPIGYADGIPRAAGLGKAFALVRGQEALFTGRVCMDMLMLDVTDIPSAQTGDEAVIFGWQGARLLSVNQLAAASDTIAYEILTRISSRVRRIFTRDT